MSLKSLILALIFTLFCIQFNSARIHHLSLRDDSREQITISTFGFLKKGLMQLKTKLDFNHHLRLETVANAFAFVLEKTNNNGFSSFSSDSNKQAYCKIVPYNNTYKSINKFTTNFKMIKNLNKTQKHSHSLVLFELDLMSRQALVTRIGSDLKSVNVKSKLTNKYGFDSLVSGDPKLNDTKNDMSDELLNNIDLYDTVKTEFINFNLTNNSSLMFKFEVNIESQSEEGLYILSMFNCFQPQNLNYKLSKEDLNVKTSRYDPLSTAAENSVKNAKGSVDLNDFKYGINLELDLLERNEDSFLSAGEMPVPTLYLTWSIIYFLAGISWLYILKSSKGDVYKIHYLMLALVFIKSISLTFHAINLHYIAVNGIHEAVWAILYYITYVLRGLLLIISILLVGTGWTFIKSILSENERRLFVIVIPLQILAIAAYIFLEEKEEGDAVYVTWRQLFFLLDLLCCGAILFPVVWSIRHLEKACTTDGKVVTSLKKLKVFKHFYIMVIFYIYFTRIIGFLLKQMLPFRYEWLDELSIEIVTFTFFAFTAYKFQPTSNNPYLQLSQEETEDLIMNSAEMIHLNDDFNLNMSNPNDADIVFDIIEHDSASKHSQQQHNNTECLQPCGPDTPNPNLFSRSTNNIIKSNN